MNKYVTYILLMFALLLEGCAYKEMTYFRKHTATVDDERRDWRLCGGSFLPDGQVSPNVDPKVLQCMNEKGYQSLNDYYEEQQISFVNNLGPDPWYVPGNILDACGFRRLKDGICGSTYYVEKYDIAKVMRCMSSHGYRAVPPRYKSSFRIIESKTPPNSNFCLYLTPKNGKGGVSLGGRRLE